MYHAERDQPCVLGLKCGEAPFTHESGAHSHIKMHPVLDDLAIKQFQVTFDCAEPERLARFWCEVLGYVVPPPPEVSPRGTTSSARSRLRSGIHGSPPGAGRGKPQPRNAAGLIGVMSHAGPSGMPSDLW